MIIKNIYIDGFGIYHNFSLPAPLRKGINILYGENEAGKSTLLHFLRYTFFGYPSARKLPKMEPLAGGKHGGRIVAETLSGDQVVFERHAATKQGQIQLHYNDKVYNDENMWFRLLGNANEKLFNNIYAFTLDELIDYGSLNDSGMQDRLFSIGIGLNTSSIQEIENKIKSSMNQIYVERGRTKKVNELLEQIKTKQSHLAILKDKRPLFDELSKEVVLLEEQAEILETKINDAHLALNKTTNLSKCYSHFVALQQIDESLAILPAYEELPGQWKEDLTTAEERLRRHRENENKLTSEINHSRSKHESITPDIQILENKPKIIEIRDNLNLYQQHIRSYQERREEHTQVGSEIEKLTTQLGTYVPVSEINEINSEVIRDKITTFINQRKVIEDRDRAIRAKLDAAYDQISFLNIKWISISFGLILLLGAVALYYYNFQIGAALMASAGVIMIMAGPLMKSDKKLKVFQKQVVETENELQKLDIQISSFIKNAFKTNLEFEPLTALKMTGAIDQIQEKVRQKLGLISQMEGLKKSIVSYEQNVAQLIEKINKEIPGNVKEVAVNTLLGLLQQEENHKQKKEDLQNQINKQIIDLENLESQISTTEKEVTNILARANVKTRDEFIKRYEQNKNVADLLDEKKANTMAIEIIFGAGKSNVVASELKATDKTKLETQHFHFDTDLRNLKTQQKELLDRLGGIKKERDSLMNTSELARLATEIETLKENLKMARKDWLTNRIALDLLQSVKNKYEKEKQPEVIGKAKKHFSKITDGKYPDLRVPFGQQEITISDRHKKIKALRALSRGTKEQLLLSLRLGFIESYEKEAEPLPIVMDEVLVNFDEKRAQKLSEILSDFGQNRQILIFTCHRHTADLFENKKLNLINL